MRAAANNILRRLTALPAYHSLIFIHARNIYYTAHCYRDPAIRSNSPDIGPRTAALLNSRSGKCRAFERYKSPIMPDVKFVYFTGLR